MASTCTVFKPSITTLPLSLKASISSINKSEHVTLNNHEHFQTDLTKYAYITVKKVKITAI